MAVPSTSTIPRTYKGIDKFDVATGAACANPTIMRSVDEVCAFCADATSNSTGNIGTLPEDLRPTSTVSIPVTVDDGHEKPGVLDISPNGNMVLSALELSLSASASGSYDEETGNVSVSVSVDGYPYMATVANARVGLNGRTFSLVGNTYNWDDAQGDGGDDAG